MVTITDSGIRNTVYESIYDALNATLSSMGASSTPTLFGGYPDKQDLDFPIIILKPINISEDSFTIDTSRTTSTKAITANIEVYAVKNKDLDIISDYIFNLFRSTNITGIFITGMDDNDMITIPNNNKVKGKTLTLSFLRR
jgi:hypothetical protein